MSFTKDRFLNFSFFADESLFSDHISGYTSGGTIMETRLH